MDNLRQVAGILVKWLPPLRKQRSPSVACVIGFLLGGIGLGLYFWSVVDVLIPIAIVLLLAKLVGPGGILAGAIVAALYGYARALTSNERLAAKDAVTAARNDTRRHATKRRHVTLAELVIADVLAPESRLFAERGKERWEAQVRRDGTLDVTGHGSATSPSAAARLVRGRRTNGWNFWKVQTNTGVVRLAALRDEAVRMRRLDN